MKAAANQAKKQVVNFTKKAFLQIAPPETGSKVLYDKILKDLGIRINAGGTKTFFLLKKVRGQAERITLGRFPDMSIEQARRKAQKLLSEIAEGSNPLEAQRRIKGEFTFEELFGHWMKTHAELHKRETSLRSDRILFRLHLKPLHNKRISNITREDCKRIHLAMKEKPYAANRAIALVRSIFNFAKNEELISTNPAEGIKFYYEESRERFMNKEEIRRFFIALGEEPNPDWIDFFVLLLLTGVRRGALQTMRWVDVSFEDALWVIPRSASKNKKPLRIPLCVTAIEILRSRKDKAIDSPWIFPARYKLEQPLDNPYEAWKRIIKRAGIENIRPHDLRRTLGSWLTARGESAFIIQKAGGWDSQKSVAVYARLDLEPVRAAINGVTDAILRAGLPEPEAAK